MTRIEMTKQNWYAANPFFENKDAYDNFAEAMLQAADDGELPMCLEHNDPENLTMQDIKQFSKRFKQDTGLSIEFRLMSCNHCDRLHCLIIVEESEEIEGNKNDRNETDF